MEALMVDDDFAPVLAKCGQEFTEALRAFIGHVEQVTGDHYRATAPSLPLPSFSLEVGQKNIRVVRTDYGDNRSVHCFVDMATGDVLKADSWKRPAKGPRGNIRNADNGRGALTPYGTYYK
jgi:hypothetical protein